MKIPASRSYAWLVYVILWGMVWGYPVSTALVVAVRVGSAFSWDGVLHSWAAILPFFLLFLIHRLPVRCLFMHHRVQVYVLSVIGLLCLFGLYRYYSDIEKPRVSSVQEHRVPPHGRLPVGNPFRTGMTQNAGRIPQAVNWKFPLCALRIPPDTKRYPCPCCWIS